MVELAYAPDTSVSKPRKYICLMVARLAMDGGSSREYISPIANRPTSVYLGIGHLV